MTFHQLFVRTTLAALLLLLPSCAITGFFTYGLVNAGVNSVGVGDRAPDAAVSSIYGSDERLLDYLHGRPLVLIFGSFT